MKKVMFNDRFGLTVAVLNGSKTQTRRVCKYERPSDSQITFPVFEAKDYNDKGECVSPLFGAFGWQDKDGNFTGWNIPKYKVGEVVAIAQSYEELERTGYQIFVSQYSEKDAGWKNKMFVAADPMPNSIRITGLRIEQLQDISEEDCIKEGIGVLKANKVGVALGFDKKYEIAGEFGIYDTAREAYSVLIDKVSGKGTWESNPFVWVYDFELIK